ncbi:MAG: UDP-N-acetylglucosamine 1-carboxyvinyltransferase [Ruminococcus sp.]|nr:UDP-N-acetylglucosamine 1-carboxyvinyltransferase [Ruminococcus sp.]
MSVFAVDGGRRLSGEVKLQGSKNSALPILAATLLCRGECVLHNCPRLSDVEASLSILRYIGCTARREGSTVIVDTGSVTRYDIPAELMHRMRSSIIFLGALIARFDRARMSFPGGCELGPRPIDLHLSALRAMGADISEEHGELDCCTQERLCGANISLPLPSVGATENIMIAAATADGTTVISNAAREPEIVDLADFLNVCGARIRGAGESTVMIDGVERLRPATHVMIPDRIVAATLMSAAAVTGSNIRLTGVIPAHLQSVFPVFRDSGCELDIRGNTVRISAPYRLHSPKLIRTMPYPGFPTDAQAPVMSMAAVADGMTVFVENMFLSRYSHVSELCRFGADIRVEGKVAVVDGVRRLLSADVRAHDLRGAAALVAASLCAKGQSEIRGIEYLERGYEDFELVLSSLGADVKKI